MNTLFSLKVPDNEPVLEFRKGSPERTLLEAEIKKLKNETLEIPLIIGGKEIRTGDTAEIVMPTCCSAASCQNSWDSTTGRWPFRDAGPPSPRARSSKAPAV